MVHPLKYSGSPDNSVKYILNINLVPTIIVYSLFSSLLSHYLSFLIQYIHSNNYLPLKRLFTLLVCFRKRENVIYVNGVYSLYMGCVF